MSVLAVIAARNEAGYIQVTLATLIEDGVEVMLLDHGSIDGTRELAEPFLGRGLVGIEHVPWRGVFDLEELLERKQEVYRAAPASAKVRMPEVDGRRTRRIQAPRIPRRGSLD